LAVAQTRKKRRRKHRGTQGGRIDAKRRARPRNRQEAKAQARSRRGAAPRADAPPTWRSAIGRGVVAALIFFVVILLLFGRSPGSALVLGALMLAFYIPAGYYIDQMMWRKRERARIRAREKS
jgi:hypothetical protein